MTRNSRLLAMALPVMIVLFGAVIYDYGYLRIRSDLAVKKDAAFVKAKTLEQYRALIADGPGIEKSLIEMRESRKAENAKLIEGQTPSISAAALQGTIKTMITARGGTISSERVEKPEDAGKFKMITVTIDAIVPDIRALSDALYAIETQTPYLAVRELDARIRNFREPRELAVKLKVSGLTGGR